jgi:hypothetical protein
MLVRRFGVPGICLGLLLGGAVSTWWHWDQVVSRPGAAAVLRSLQPLPVADPSRFAVVVTRFHGDDEGTFRRIIFEGLREMAGVQVLSADTTIAADDDDSDRARQTARAATARVFQRTGAQLVLWGAVLRDGDSRVLKLYWTPEREASVDTRFGRYRPTQLLELPEDFRSELAEVVQLVIARVRAELRMQEAMGSTQDLAAAVERIRGLVDGHGRSTVLTGRAELAAQIALADAEMSLALASGEPEDAERVVSRTSRLLHRVSRERAPLDWGTLRYTSAMGYHVMSWCKFVDRDGEDLQAAVAAFREARVVYSRETHPHEWARAQLGLALALLELHWNWECCHEEEAVRTLRELLTVVSPQDEREIWVEAVLTLGDVLTDWPSAIRDVRRVAQAQELYQNARDQVSAESSPSLWMGMELRLASVMIELGRRTQDESLAESGRRRVRAVLASHTPLSRRALARAQSSLREVKYRASP